MEGSTGGRGEGNEKGVEYRNNPLVTTAHGSDSWQLAGWLVVAPLLFGAMLLLFPASLSLADTGTMMLLGVAAAVGGVTSLGILGRLPQGGGLLTSGLRWLWEGESRSRLEAVRGEGGVEFFPAPEEDPGSLLPEAHCIYCGGDFLKGGAVRCLRCDTPHHEECWIQGRHCSVYGCGEIRAVRVGAGGTVEAPPPEDGEDLGGPK
jgi:hypothetical protein